MSNFKLHDRVKIRSDSEFYARADDPSNPITLEGIIVELTDDFELQEDSLLSHDPTFNIWVEWDNGHQNNYRPYDLKLVTKILYPDE